MCIRSVFTSYKIIYYFKFYYKLNYIKYFDMTEKSKFENTINIALIS